MQQDLFALKMHQKASFLKIEQFASILNAINTKN